MSKGFAALLVALSLLPATGWAGTYVYPQKGQSPAQQQKDNGECYSWAVNQTGFDPARASSQPAYREGGVVRGGARGAAAGAVIGAIAGDAGKGAAAGAAGGALLGGMRRRDQQRSIDANNAAGQNEFNKAFAACMNGRGYSVN